MTLSQCEFAMGKTEMVCEMNQRETHRYEQMHSDIGKCIVVSGCVDRTVNSRLCEQREVFKKHRLRSRLLRKS